MSGLKANVKMDFYCEYLDDFSKNQSDPVIKHICNILIQNFDDDNVMEILSDDLELSPDYIRVMFKNKTGINFNRFMVSLKLEKAKYLLTNSNSKIYAISEECGYITVDYFTRIFKNYTGLTPLQYRKEKRVV